VASIERYEARMAWVRDGVWVFAILCAFLGWVHFAEALILGGVAWFGMALLRKVPRSFGRYRPYFVSQWRRINRVLMFQVVATTLIGEMVRTGRIEEVWASLAFLASLGVSLVLLLRLWKGFQNPQLPLP
jgi:hypothetical protein